MFNHCVSCGVEDTRQGKHRWCRLCEGDLRRMGVDYVGDDLNGYMFDLWIDPDRDRWVTEAGTP